MESYRWLRYSAGLLLLIFNAVMFAFVVTVGFNVVASCVSYTIFIDSGRCLADLGMGRLWLSVLPIGNAVLMTAIVVSFIWSRIVSRPIKSEEPRTRTPRVQMDVDDSDVPPGI